MSKNILFKLFIVLALFIPLYPKFPLLNVPGTYVAIRIEDVFILLSILTWGFLNIKNLKLLLSQTINQAILLFFLTGFISYLSALFITHSVSPGLGMLHLLRRVEYLSLFFLGASAIKDTKQIKIFLFSMLVATIIIVIYGFGQIYLHLPVISTTNREFSKGLILTLTPDARPNSTFAGHYDLAAYLSLALIFLGTLFFQFRQKLIKLAILFTSGISAVMLALTAARISFLAAFIGLALSLLFLGKRLLIIGLVILSIVIVVAIPQLRNRLIATVTVNFLGESGQTYVAPQKPSPIPKEVAATASAQYLNKLVHEASAQASISAAAKKKSGVASDIAPGEPVKYTDLDVYRSYNIRLNVEWPRALRSFIKNPLLGTGYSSLTIATDNDILRSLGEVGLLGTLALGLIFYIILKRLISSLKRKTGLEKAFLISSICASIALLITTVFIDVLEASKIALLFWLTMGAAWSIASKE